MSGGTMPDQVDVLLAEDHAQPISLYFDLEDGQTADLEVVARAALAWTAAIKELAYVLDPSLEVRVEISSGTPGSFTLNSVIEAVRKAKDQPVTLGALAILIILWMGAKVADRAMDGALDRVFGADEKEIVAKFDPEQMKEFEDRLARGLEAKVAQRHIQQVYREAERDPAIRGVGATTKVGQRPQVIVPRAKFAEQAGHGQIRVETITRRVIPSTLRVTLIKPALIRAERRWSLKTPSGEFGFAMKDKDFVERVLSGSTATLMVAGIEMDVETETTEELQNGVWTPTERSVIRVVRLYPPLRQTVLPFSPPENNQPSDDDD